MDMPIVLSKRHRRLRSMKDCEPGLPYNEIVENGKRIDLCYSKQYKKYTKKIEIRVGTSILHNKLLRIFPNIVKIYSKHFINLPDLITENTEKRELIFIELENLIIGGGTSGLGVLSEISKEEKTLLISSNIESNTDIPYPLPQINKDEFSKLLRDTINENKDRILEGILLGKFDEGIGFLTKDKILMVRAKRVFLATGGRYIPPIFDGNDIPGIISKNLYLRYGNRITKAIALGNSDDIIKVLFKVEKRVIINNGVLFLSKYYKELIDELGVEIINTNNLKVKREKGGMLKIITNERSFDSNILVYAIVKQPKIDHSYNIGIPYNFSEYFHIYMPIHSIEGKTNDNIYIVGGMRGISDEYTSFLSGKTAVNEKYLDEFINNLKDYTYIYDYYYQKNPKENPSPYIYGNKGYVCECEDITLSEVNRQVGRGFSKVEEIKRTIGLGTGECQGKLCTYSLGSFLGDRQLITFRTPLYRMVI
ncbi:(2Fe-2S)-binding protein [Saccharolobus solfataricus]|nr:(2Fe-2S)-binding protein [Saccharolobus solfataricus]AKA75053.1 (2Fe-2S)-binding protein [Saccharolobus solfataricus]AKA77747.1 (2Fe-2S)-binding protein [Saccharolobus solfataricus]AKA80440.1 (2Fe-2S)-binding protein [Saccharolobus solfataricus]AZF69503.1 (2Fe-2S)-binding protein [Saccharolobus solfataricus]AZF72123.1 (2Fe-2S)-binding protein [Saccharolobus solfataricus]